METSQRSKVEVGGGGDESVIEFLDSVDTYLLLFDSLSSTLRQGWLELASARHSMGTSRINSVLLDMNVHSAATTLQPSGHDDFNNTEGQPQFTLRKWVSSNHVQDSSDEVKFGQDELGLNSDVAQLRNRKNNSQLSEDIASTRNDAPLKVDDQVQKVRSKSLSVFGGLVSPKLRESQLSFETALERIVEIANARSRILSSFNQVGKDLGSSNC
ncbi:hypothetical protein ACFE04_015128 [Oxalis oulophora]